jgi:FkbM family methyltransferase
MLGARVTQIVERLRCAKHNWLDRQNFSLSFEENRYAVRTKDEITLCFPRNPYLELLHVQGYLRHGLWTLEPGMNVVDVGACQGEFALYASARVGRTGRVFVMEPDPSNIALLEEVFVVNGGKPQNLILIKEGLWKHRGTLEFAAGHGLVSKVAALTTAGSRGSEKKITIPVHSLTSLVASFGITKLDFVKIDIEGAEIEAVEGARQVIEELKPRFAIASYHVRDGKPTSEILPELFAAVGYHVETGFEQHRTTYASPVPLS